jgi:tyrosinase
MSTTACDGTSFENIHNEVHVAVGCLHPMGHFAHLGFSGFDPIFMLHHAGIDRHVALWQAIYYNESMFNTTYTSYSGQYSTAPGTNISADSPLKPFYADDRGTFHTSNSAKDVTSFGYTYPELLGDFKTPEELSSYIKTQVNLLYSNTSTQSNKRQLDRINHVDFSVQVRVDKGDVELPSILRVLCGDLVAGRLVLLDTPKRGIVYTEIPLRHILESLDNQDETLEQTISSLKQILSWDITRVSLPTSQPLYIHNYESCEADVCF